MSEVDITIVAMLIATAPNAILIMKEEKPSFKLNAILLTINS